MGNNWFKKPKDLEEKKSTFGSSYFKKAGDLNDDKPSNDMSSHFTRAGDLEPTVKERQSFKFKEKTEKNKTSDEIITWLKTIESGKKKSNYASGEGLMATGGGQKFVTIDELNQMLDNGDNIISAQYFENMKMILVEFESFNLPNTSKSR